MARVRAAVLISGGGSNLQALLDAAAARPGFPAEIALVIADRPGAFGLERAARAGVPRRLVDRGAHPDRASFDAALDAALTEAGVELVCLAGFLRILTDGFVERWRNRMLNVHPSLLPAFRGLGTHARALAAGVKAHGCTVHLVRPELDTGPILAQGLAPVLPDDTPERLAARVLELEHRCYPWALELVASGRAARPGEGLFLHPLLHG